MNDRPTLLLKVPPQLGKTNHWETHSDAIQLLGKAKVKGSKWHHASGPDQFFSGKFTDKQLTWLGLYGCEVTKNLTEARTHDVKAKINQALSTLKFTDTELKEVDVISILVQSFKEHFGVEL
jgi:hypothetical protein